MNENILYNTNKWLGVWDKPKYTQLRNKILNSFNELKFIEEGHRYFIGDKEMFSVSVVTHLFKKEFNSEIEAQKTYERNFNNKRSKYYQMTAEEILKQWKNKADEACALGTARHEFGESCFYYMTGQYDKILPAFKNRLREDGGFEAIYPEEVAVVKLYRDIPKEVIPILAETKVYDEELGYAGTFDILFYFDSPTNPDKSGFLILDFKTNEDLFKNFKDEKLLKPFTGLLDMPLSIYKLQLSLYENCLDRIGLKTIGRRILWLKPDGVYEKINLESYMGALRKTLSETNLMENLKKYH